MRLGEKQDVPAPSWSQWGRQLPATGCDGQAETGAGNWVSHNQGECHQWLTFGYSGMTFLPCFFGPETSSWSWKTFPSKSHFEISVFSKVDLFFLNNQLYSRYSDFALHLSQNVLLRIASTAAWTIWQQSPHLVTLFVFSFSSPAGLVLGN